VDCLDPLPNEGGRRPAYLLNCSSAISDACAGDLTNVTVIPSSPHPQFDITINKSAEFTTPSPSGGVAMSAGQFRGGAGQAPHWLITANRSSTSTTPSPSMSAGRNDGTRKSH